jgi:DNA-binding MarR family transcriptional regulator
MTAGELAKITGLTTGAVTGMIDRFEQKKLVKRKFAADDRRKVFIEPNTEKIMTLLAPLYKEFRTRSEALTATFSAREIKVIEKYLSSAVELMHETTANLNKKRTTKSKANGK